MHLEKASGCAIVADTEKKREKKTGKKNRYQSWESIAVTSH